MIDISGKKLLIFGGIGPMGDLITLAHRNHVTVGVADYNSDTYIKKRADYAHDVDILDVDAVVELYKKEKYDGIITNFNDMLMPYAAEVASKVGAYVPYTKEQIRMSTDKKYFKDKCIQFNVPVPKEYNIEEGYSKIEYPVIVKPVDGSGSKGISISYNLEELKLGIEKAKKSSRSGKIIVEQYIEYDDEINLTYIIQKGKVQLAAIHDRYFNKTQSGFMRVPDLYVYPSKYTNSIMRDINPAVTRMLEAIGLIHGSLFIQGCVKDGKVYLYEAGMRLNGCKTYQILEYENKYNTFEHLLKFALSGDMGEYCEFSPKFKKWYATWNVVSRPGRIEYIKGIDEIESYPWMIHNAMAYHPGDCIPETAVGTLIQLQSRIHVCGDTIDELIKNLEILYDLYHVYDDRGTEMILTPHDMNELRKSLSYDLL